MNLRRVLPVIIILLFYFSEAHSQEVFSSAGGNATGSGGSASLTVGQVVYTPLTGPTGSVVPGVQQPFEISGAVGIGLTEIILEPNVFPNPTSNYLNLIIANYPSNLSYQLFDLKGTLLKDALITSSTSQILFEKQPKSTYFLNVIEEDQVIKTFRIIKN